MQTNAAAHQWRTSLAWSAVFRAAGLSIFGLVVWRWLISADGHAGASMPEYREHLESRWHDEFDAWEAAFVNPFADLVDTDADRNWDSGRRLRELEADGIVAEVLFPNTVPPFFPSGALVAPAPPSTRPATCT